MSGAQENVFADYLARAAAPCEEPAEAPAPGGSVRSNSTQKAKARREAASSKPPTVTAGHEMAFAWLRHGEGQFGLLSCYVNGEPSALIAAGEHRPDGKVAIMPFFIALTKGMRVTTPDGDVVWEDEE